MNMQIHVQAHKDIMHDVLGMGCMPCTIRDSPIPEGENMLDAFS